MKPHVMDSVYAITLLAGITTGALACLHALLLHTRWREALPGRGFVAAAAGGAWLAVLISIAAHLGWSHRPGTPDALPVGEFVAQHVAYVAAVALPALALLIARGAKRDRDGPGL